MKKCPYCSEEIQDDAIKCKHCNEWLEKKNSFTGFLAKTKDAIKKQVEENKAKKTSHLYLPTNENPLRIERITLFPDRIEYDNKVFFLKDIRNILYYCSTTSYNLLTSNDYLSFYLIFNKIPRDNDNLNCQKIYCFIEDDTVLGRFVSNKTRQQLMLMYQIVSKSTSQQRLNYYLNELETNGYFTYREYYKIYKNGDLHVEDKFKANIKQAYDNDLLNWGASWKGFRSAEYNPYEFTIYENPGLRMKVFGFDTSSKTKIETTIDLDIFTLLMFSFLQTGDFHPSHNIADQS